MELVSWQMTGIAPWRLSYDCYFIQNIKSSIISQVEGQEGCRIEKKGGPRRMESQRTKESCRRIGNTDCSLKVSNYMFQVKPLSGLCLGHEIAKNLYSTYDVFSLVGMMKAKRVEAISKRVYNDVLWDLSWARKGIKIKITEGLLTVGP